MVPLKRWWDLDLNTALKEFQEFLDTAQKINLKMEEAQPINLELNQFPIFYLPDWPDKVPSLKVHLGLKRSWFLEKKPEMNLYRLRKKVIAIVIIITAIKNKGNIKVRCINPLDTSNFIEFDSASSEPANRLNCFLIFSQNIKKSASKINKMAEQLLRQTSAELSDSALVVAKVNESLKPFIPFLVADKLTEEAQK
jgi:hypothetical protein